MIRVSFRATAVLILLLEIRIIGAIYTLVIQIAPSLALTSQDSVRRLVQFTEVRVLFEKKKFIELHALKSSLFYLS